MASVWPRESKPDIRLTPQSTPGGCGSWSTCPDYSTGCVALNVTFPLCASQRGLVPGALGEFPSHLRSQCFWFGPACRWPLRAVSLCAGGRLGSVGEKRQDSGGPWPPPPPPGSGARFPFVRLALQKGCPHGDGGALDAGGR